MSKISNFINKLQGVRRTGPGKWIAKCPAHKDRSPSLSLKETPDGDILLYCFSGCSFGDVIAALGLTAADCFANSRQSTPQYRKAAVWHSLDAELEILQSRYGLSLETARELAAIGRLRESGGSPQ